MAKPRKTVALYFRQLCSAGGAERMVCELANALTTRGYSVHLVTLDDAHAHSFYSLSTAVAWHRLGLVGGFADKFRRSAALRAVLTKHAVATLVGFVMSGDKTVYAAALLSGTRLIAAERNAPSMYRLRYNLLQRTVSFAMLHLTDAITIQFASFATGYPRSLRSKLTVIANPVPAAKQPLASPAQATGSGRYTLLCVSRLDEVQKRLNVLIDAFAILADSFADWDLRIVGDGPHERQLREQIDALGLSARVNIQASTADVFEIYAKAHLFVLPSRWEGFPNALAEAMACGLPPIGFAGSAGVADLIKQADGWLATGLDDRDSLARTLREAMSHPTERQAKGARAAQAMQQFSAHQIFARWDALLDDVAKRQ